MPSLLLSVIKGPVSEPLTQFLVQVVIILVLVRLLAKLLQRIRQPMVIGEIVAGVLLGPSAFGQIPGFSDAIFPKSSLPILGLIANVALIFFMFFLGLEVEVGLMTKAWKSAAPTAVVSIIVPFFCGAAIAPWVASIDTPSSYSTAFLLFLGTAFSFTAFPVLARILTTNRMLSTSLGIQSLSCAAIDDVLAWCTLALTLSYATGGSALAGLYTALIAIGFVLFLIFVVRPILVRLHRRLIERNDEMNKNFITALFLLLCAASWFAQIIGVHAFFGAFAFGIIVPKEGALHISLAMRLELLIVEFLLPLYFAHSGLSTDVSRMDSGRIWAVCLVVCVLACISKILPCMIMTRLLTGCFGFGYDAKSLKQIEEEQLQPAMERENVGGRDAATGEDHELGLNGIEMAAYSAKESSSNASARQPDLSAADKRTVRVLSPVAESMVESDKTIAPDVGGINGHFNPRNNPISHASAHPQPRSWTNWFGMKRFVPASWCLCLSVGVLMNTRGLVALIVLNIGLDKGILTVKVFTVMVLMSLVTTLLTPPALYALFVRGWDQQLLQQDEQRKRRQAEEEQEKQSRERDYNEYLRYSSELKQRRQTASTLAATEIADPQLVQVSIVPVAPAGDLLVDAQAKSHDWTGNAPLPLTSAGSNLGAIDTPVMHAEVDAGQLKGAAAPAVPMAWHGMPVSPPPVSLDEIKTRESEDDGWLSTASFFRDVNLRCSRSPSVSAAPHRPRSRSHPRSASTSQTHTAAIAPLHVDSFRQPPLHSSPLAATAAVSTQHAAFPDAPVDVDDEARGSLPSAAAAAATGFEELGDQPQLAHEQYTQRARRCPSGSTLPHFDSKSSKNELE